jgi:hypothetical protein
MWFQPYRSVIKPESSPAPAANADKDRRPGFVCGPAQLLRAAGCIAYFEAEAGALEVIAPHLFGRDEDKRLQNLLRSWQLEHPEIGVEAITDVAA